ncbi:helix-turn-helix domain-containing protein [Coralloluteibacterium thermophilus]|uniref:Helix-turn-helix domain-containing protein n=1 Tax=Coralloluteibacterium thermophilum TaxID=2707049 RepID=A0ABV9NHD3_9GAMM
MNMTKRAVREALGFTMDRELAAFFNVSKGAISAWSDDEPIPEGRQWELRARRPDLFDAPPSSGQQAA